MINIINKWCIKLEHEIKESYPLLSQYFGFFFLWKSPFCWLLYPISRTCPRSAPQQSVTYSHQVAIYELWSVQCLERDITVSLFSTQPHFVRPYKLHDNSSNAKAQYKAPPSTQKVIDLETTHITAVTATLQSTLKRVFLPRRSSCSLPFDRPQPIPKPVHHTVRSSASSLRLQFLIHIPFHSTVT